MTQNHTLTGTYLWDQKFAQAIDKVTSTEFHLSEDTLIELAGHEVAKTIVEHELTDAPIIVLCGSGKNGADSLVAARWLCELGLEVHVYLVKEEGKALHPATQSKLHTFEAFGYEAKIFTKSALKTFQRAEPIIIDGIYGVGFDASKGSFSTSLAWAALSEAALIPGRTVVAVDLPSGLAADQLTECVIPLKADLTLTFGEKKPALALAPARDKAGEVVVLNVGFPKKAESIAESITRPLLMLPHPDELIEQDPWDELPKSAHKYDRGHILIIGGSPGKTGAPLMSGMAALRAGAGWVTIAMPKSALESLKGDVPREIVFEDLFNGEELDLLKLEKFLAERKVKAIVIGPGMSSSPFNKDLMTILPHVLSKGGGIVVDAGATHNFISYVPSESLIPSRWVLLPHPGEWVKMGAETAALPDSKEHLIKYQKLAENLGITLLYKGATPLCFTGLEGLPILVADEGDNSLGKAGSGDLLAGLVAAHLALRDDGAWSSMRALTQLAWSAKLAAKGVGKHGVMARDILAKLSRVKDLLDEGHN